MTKRITVTIHADGTFSAESSGQAGTACLDDMTVIEALCDSGIVVGSNLTPEYFTEAQIVRSHQAVSFATEEDLSS